MTVVDKVGTAPRQLVRTSPQGGLRAIESEGRPGIRLQLLRYNVVDDYGSVWLPGALSAGLGERLPTLVWAHDRADVIGRATSWTDTDDGPLVDFYLDDFDAVPRARQAYAQVKSGTIDDCSIGFDWEYDRREPTADDLRRWPKAKEIVSRAMADETSLVLRGAVPGAGVLSWRATPSRSAPLRVRSLRQRTAGVISEDDATRILAGFSEALSAGKPRTDAFLAAIEDIKTAAVVPPEASDDTEEVDDTPDAEPTEDEKDVEDGDTDAAVAEGGDPGVPEEESSAGDEADDGSGEGSQPPAPVEAVSDSEPTAVVEDGTTGLDTAELDALFADTDAALAGLDRL